MADLPLTATVGILLRGAFRRQVTRFCWSLGWDVTIVEDRGLLTSAFKVTVTVPDHEADEAAIILEAYAEQLTQAMS